MLIFYNSWQQEQQEQQQMTLFSTTPWNVADDTKVTGNLHVDKSFQPGRLFRFLLYYIYESTKPCPEISATWVNAIIIVHGCGWIYKTHKVLHLWVFVQLTECLCPTLVQRYKMWHFCFKMSKNNDTLLLFPDLLTVCYMFSSMFKPRGICLSFESR